MKTKKRIRSLDDLAFASQRSRYAVEYANKLACGTIVHTANPSQNSMRRLNGAIEQLGYSGYYCSSYEFSALAREEKITALKAVHRDGVDFVLTMLIDRNNLSGGESFAYAQDGQTLQASVTLKEAGDFIFLNAKRMKHSVEPISRLDPANEGCRNALIAMFTQHPLMRL